MARKDKARTVFSRLAAAAVLLALATGLSGCYLGPAGFNPFVSGADMPEREEVFEVALAGDFDFDPTLISTEYGDSENQVVMRGPILQVLVSDSTDPMREGWAIEKVEWTSLVWERVDGEWTLIDGTTREARKFSGTLS